MKLFFTILLLIIALSANAQYPSYVVPPFYLNRWSQTPVAAMTPIPGNFETNMNNRQWVTWQAGQLNNYYNIGKGSWAHTLANLTARKTIKVEIDGTGFVNGWLGSIATNFYAQFPCAGAGNMFVNPSWPENFAVPSFLVNVVSWNGANNRGNPMAGWWYGQAYDMTNDAPTSNSVVMYEANFPFNQIEIDADCAPWGGKFTLYTNAAAGSYAATNSTGLQFNTQTTGGAFYGTNWTVTLPCQFVENEFGGYNVYLVQSAPGTNRIVDEWAFNTNILYAATNGVVVNQEAGSSTTVTNQMSVSNLIASVIYSNWFPTMILYQNIEDTNAILSSAQGVSALVAFYTNNCPGADVCLSGVCPTILDGTGTSEDAVMQNLAYMVVAQNYNVAYFDPYTPMEATNNLVLRGWFDDGIHPDGNSGGWSGFSAWTYWWYNWLQPWVTNYPTSL